MNLQKLHKTFMEQEIKPYITQKSLNLISKHKKQGDYCLIITATNLFITGPIAQYLGMDDIIATVPEIKDGEYTGKVEGIPSFQEGKVERLAEWLKEHPELSLKGSYFYSDSINDLPLLEQEKMHFDTLFSPPNFHTNNWVFNYFIWLIFFHLCYLLYNNNEYKSSGHSGR